MNEESADEGFNQYMEGRIMDESYGMVSLAYFILSEAAHEKRTKTPTTFTVVINLLQTT
jgi:hypothetical protein